MKTLLFFCKSLFGDETPREDVHDLKHLDSALHSAFRDGHGAGHARGNPHIATSDTSDAYVLGAHAKQNNLYGPVRKRRGYNWSIGDQHFRVDGDQVTALGKMSKAVDPQQRDGRAARSTPGGAATLNPVGQKLHVQYARLTAQRNAVVRTHGKGTPQYDAIRETHGAAARGLAEHVQGVAGGEDLHLPQNHEDYFHHTAETQHVPLHAIEPIRARGGGIARAEPSMALARVGLESKREPISLEHQGNGKYKVLDGNSTFAIAHKHGWDSMPAHVWEKGQWSDAGEMKKSLRFSKSANNGGLPSSHPVSQTLADNSSRLKMKNETAVGNPNLLGSGRSRQPKEQNTAEKLRSVGGAVKPHYDALLHRVGEKFGFHHAAGWNPDVKGQIPGEVAKGHKAGGMVLTAPLKSAVKIQSNAENKYQHDQDSKQFRPETDTHGEHGYNRITDVVRGSLAVRHRADLPHVMHHLRKEMAHPDSHFELAEEPKDNFETPKNTGYSDFNMRLRHKKTGHVTELQLHTLDMLHAKDAPGVGEHGSAGHKYYDDQVSIEKKKKAGTATPQDLSNHSDLLAKQRHLYGHAVLSTEATRKPHIETNRVAHGLAQEHIIATNHATHEHGHLMRADGSHHAAKM